MCGVFGFVAKGESAMSMSVIRRIAEVTERRGPHAWGLAWINRAGRLCMFKQTGRVSNALGMLSMARDATALVGHTRFATQGTPANNLNNHPHPCDGGWIVHNGRIPDYRWIIDRYRLHPVTDCDSEVLALLVEQLAGSLVERCADAATIAGSRKLVMLGLWKPGRVVAVRAGNPLHVGETRGGYYLASLAEGLPGDVNELDDNAAIEIGGDCSGVTPRGRTAARRGRPQTCMPF